MKIFDGLLTRYSSLVPPEVAMSALMIAILVAVVWMYSYSVRSPN